MDVMSHFKEIKYAYFDDKNVRNLIYWNLIYFRCAKSINGASFQKHKSWDEL